MVPLRTSADVVIYHPDQCNPTATFLQNGSTHLGFAVVVVVVTIVGALGLGGGGGGGGAVVVVV